MRAWLIALIAAACLVTATGCATNKVQPDGSMTGVMTTGQLPEVTIDGRAMRLAPGARIYNASNLTITPNQVPANTRVRYKVDANGLVTQVWLLPAEH
ncbi:MAG TPA: hypothetical protein VMK32_08220 [Burkholderiaceae bacterium]|nr:hypothetical protein [Burkholderiaceae bacterium]